MKLKGVSKRFDEPMAGSVFGEKSLIPKTREVHRMSVARIVEATARFELHPDGSTKPRLARPNDKRGKIRRATRLEHARAYSLGMPPKTVSTELIPRQVQPSTETP